MALYARDEGEAKERFTWRAGWRKDIPTYTERHDPPAAL